jgi:methionyl-tRNA formyltransferase
VAAEMVRLEVSPIAVTTKRQCEECAMIITILTDSPQSWFVPYGSELCERLNHVGHDAVYVHDKNEIREGDICFLLSCNRIVQPEFPTRNRHNIVVHASDLPAGKGVAPVKWQILEGKNTIPITLFEAVEAVDAGDWYLKDEIHLEGHELLGEVQHRLASKISYLCVRFVTEYDEMRCNPQSGDESFYPRMTDVPPVLGQVRIGGSGGSLSAPPG